MARPHRSSRTTWSKLKASLGATASGIKSIVSSIVRLGRDPDGRKEEKREMKRWKREYIRYREQELAEMERQGGQDEEAGRWE
jgi:hypothetical protein